MSVGDQFRKIKDNWLLILLCVILFLFVFGGNLITGTFGGYSMSSMSNSYDTIGAASGYYGESDSSYVRSYVPTTQSNFAPEVTERKITKTASLSTEVEKGGYQAAAEKLKAVVSSTSSFLLNENVNTYESGKKAYTLGSYQIKIPANGYDSAVSQLKQIGKVKQFTESSNDITGTFSNLQIELDTEKARLARYEAMYAEATKIEDKINLNDRIFSEQRTIKYYEDQLRNAGQRVDYSTVSVSISEKKSDFIDVAIVKFSTLVESLVGSFNALLVIFFVVLPWGVAALLVWLIVRLIRRRGGKSRK
jgi:hypothetical protein